MLDNVREMWEALNNYHCERSTHFKEHYLSMTFQKRKYGLLKKIQGGGKLHIDVAVDLASDKSIGYLISTITAAKTGEVDSIFVESDYRGLGIGATLMKKALEWINQEGAIEKIVEVSVGNEQAWGFYAKYGFLPRKTMLKQIKKA